MPRDRIVLMQNQKDIIITLPVHIER